MILQPTSGVLNRLLRSYTIRPNYEQSFPYAPFNTPEHAKLLPPLIQPNANGGSILVGSGSYPPSINGLRVPAGFSSGGWTMEARGIQQQTFLGASIRSFTMNGGFGDSSSNLTVELVNDEYNTSDGTAYGEGIDEYHGGKQDFILPPIPGTPVFFKFGENVATTEQAYRRLFDRLYGFSTVSDSTNILKDYDSIQEAFNYFTIYRYPSNNVQVQNNLFTSLKTGQIANLSNLRYLTSTDPGRGYKHIVFGGLLQSFLQNKGSAGNPTFTIQVTDPREILSNVAIILNNYVSPTYGEKNILNPYGFLEFNLTTVAKNSVRSKFGRENKIIRIVDKATGRIYYEGEAENEEENEEETTTTTTNDPQNFSDDEALDEEPPKPPLDCYIGKYEKRNKSYRQFPITGTGMSRRSDQGIPWYRVKHSISAILGWYGPLHKEYVDAGFSTVINYKGYNYVVDFSGLPEMPDLYFLNFDQLNLLDLCLEICDVTNTELFVSLLPVINHPSCAIIFQNNRQYSHDKDRFISGIIRLDVMKKSVAPQYGSIKKYIDDLALQGINVENQDIGYELTNNVTNKFVVGAQEVEHYFFTGNHDRDISNAKSRNSQSMSMYQWLLDHQLQQQIIPFYGLLGNRAVTIPKGWGAYQQILLDTTGLDANGVGAYYVATEMELRYASISYKAWTEFLLQYNDKYMEQVNDDLLEGAALQSGPSISPFPIELQKTYAVGVPRSVFDTYALRPFGNDRLPTSACNPPYGYPLYYKRATKIGIPAAGFTQLGVRITSAINALATIQTAGHAGINDALNKLDQIQDGVGLSGAEASYIERLKIAAKNGNLEILNDLALGLHKIQASLPKLAKKGIENSNKVYNFVKKIADENLGKKFLVKMPQKVNAKYSYQIKKSYNDYYIDGPFGFKPRPTENILGKNKDPDFWSLVRSASQLTSSFIKNFLTLTPQYANTGELFVASSKYNGALQSSFNPIAYKHEFNYSLTNLGGFFDFDLYSNVYKMSDIKPMFVTDGSSGRTVPLSPNAIPKGVKQCLIPQDLTNFITQEGRISAYVRFDHSENLSLDKLNSDDFTQQIIELKDKGTSMIPDLSSALDNTQDDSISFDQMNATKSDDEQKPMSCAFVKCTVDENFYMTPPMQYRQFDLYGSYTYINQVTKPVPIFVPCSGWENGVPGSKLIPGTGCYINSYTILFPKIIPTNEPLGSDDNEGANPGSENSDTDDQGMKRLDYVRYKSDTLKSYIIKTDLESLNQNHIYALVTLPGKIVPTKTSRYRESANFDKQHWDIHHYLTMDVVKGLPEFTKPAYFKTRGIRSLSDPDKRAIGAEALSKAWLAARAAKKGIKFGGPNLLNYTVPSPVYPDLVAIPLMSNERCYGPWISSNIDVQGIGFKDIGGKVEFIKDENLSPWNYGGYDLMNEAGTLQASFANNLLLFSERGGFSVPGVPSVSLCEALIDGGPLVTNISVDVNSQGIKTTYRMDLYTPSFGKLQKQKQDSISKISRERQRIREERNKIIRNGMIKSQTRFGVGNINNIANETSNVLNAADNTYLVASNTLYNTEAMTHSGQEANSEGMFGEDEGVKPYQFITNVESENNARMTNIEAIADQSNQIDSYIDRATAMSAAGGSTMSEIYTPYSKSGYHHTLPNVQHVEPQAIQSLFNVDKSFPHFG